MPTPAQLATRHLKLTFWGGLVLVAPFSLSFALFAENQRHWSSALPLPVGILSLTTDTAIALGLWGALPALVAGWVRLIPMRWLLGWLRLRPAYPSRLIGAGGTLLLFMGTILLGALLLYLAVGRLEFILCLLVYTGFSTPWLLASLWATWRVLRPVTDAA